MGNLLDISTFTNFLRLEWKTKFELSKIKWRQTKFSDAFQDKKLEKLESTNEFKGLHSTYN